MFFRNRNKLELHLELYEDWKMMDMGRSKKVQYTAMTSYSVPCAVILFEV